MGFTSLLPRLTKEDSPGIVALFDVIGLPTPTSLAFVEE
jgi:hypothetical protein